jgi:type II secretory pathway predicted ATPase ExeA
MPFLESFGLSDYPFGLTPNPHLFFPAPHAEELLAALSFALQRGDGLIKVVGEIGTGKTLLCRMLLERLETMPVNTAYLNAPGSMNANRIPDLVMREFGLEPPEKEDPARALRFFLLEEHGRGKRNVLVVDEAQTLGAQGLEAIRLLSNLETDTDKLLQIVLFGQPELDQLLSRTDLRQLTQRLNFSFTTQPLAPQTVASYVRFRMERCTKPGAEGARFAPAALVRLAKASGGLPRVIHLLADKALLAAYVDGVNIVKPRHVRTAIEETPGLRAGWWPKRWSRAA